MKFDDLDKKMRIYETINDSYLLPGIHVVARIDGRGFTKLTKERHPFDAPFDIRFRNYMIETTKHLINCGFKVIYAYTQSDEISLLFSLHEKAFSRKERKWNSILAGEASGKFSSLLGDVAAFDCRLSQLPNTNLVIDYFRWRNEDAHRNALNAHCYWKLRQEGFSKKDATHKIIGVSIADKNELLFSYGINFNDLPSWQKRGVGLHWVTSTKESINPVTKQTVLATRQTLFVDEELPLKDEYTHLIKSIIETDKQ